MTGYLIVTVAVALSVVCQGQLQWQSVQVFQPIPDGYRQVPVSVAPCAKDKARRDERARLAKHAAGRQGDRNRRAAR